MRGVVCGIQSSVTALSDHHCSINRAPPTTPHPPAYPADSRSHLSMSPTKYFSRVFLNCLDEYSAL